MELKALIILESERELLMESENYINLFKLFLFCLMLLKELKSSLATLKNIKDAQLMLFMFLEESI
jgi:hypothetical protein